jgi:hypothetical protein
MKGLYEGIWIGSEYYFENNVEETYGDIFKIDDSNCDPCFHINIPHET